MNYPYTVYYRSEKNYSISHYQNENPYVRSKACRTLDDVKAFAKTVEVTDIYSPSGRKITL